MIWLLPIFACLAAVLLAVLDVRRRGRVDVLPPPDKAADRTAFRFPQ